MYKTIYKGRRRRIYLNCHMNGAQCYAKTTNTDGPEVCSQVSRGGGS